MEWRIVVPLLCLIGILHVPGNSAQTTNSTTTSFTTATAQNASLATTQNASLATAQNASLATTQNASLATTQNASLATTQNASLATTRNASLAMTQNASLATTQNASLATTQNASLATTRNASLATTQNASLATTQNASLATTQNASLATKSTDAPTTTAPVARVNLGFSIRQDFSENFNNLSHPETQALINNITNEFTPFYKRSYKNFLRMTIKSFRKGSVVVDSVLEFDATNGTSPNATDVKDNFVKAITSGNFSIPVDNTSISASIPETTAANTTASPVTNITATSATTVPAKVAQINLLFSIIQTFSDNFTNLNHPDTQALTTKVINECSAVYRRRFPKFFRMFIRKFSKGSIVVDSVLEFDTTNGTSPNTTELKDTLVQGIASGNFSFQVDNTSISASDISNVATTTVSAATPLTEYNITFKLNEVFTSDLSDMTSAGAIKLAKNITTELDGYFKKFTNFNRTVVLRFRNGSINTDGQIGFNGKTNNPTALDLATGLADAVRKGIVKLSIDPKSIQVTDPSGVSANRSPMLASMLTALWMTLASLLLSAVMH